LKAQEIELRDMVQVSRQLEQQRYRQYQTADEEISRLKEIHDVYLNQTEMTNEDFRGKLIVLRENY
jgi:hypothetical protein